MAVAETETSSIPFEALSQADHLAYRQTAPESRYWQATPIPSRGRPRDASFNNFDLIRLVAACQVMVGHALEHMGYGDTPTMWWIRLLPGVPVFFFTSGFLVSKSFERNSNLEAFARNRFLRIFPGLWVSVLLSIFLIFALYPISLWGLAAWALAQGSVLQDWNPGFLRGYGVGVANGALWTIPVELGFYAAVPLLYRLGGRRLDWLLAATAAVSFSVLSFAMTLPQGSFEQKLIMVTPIPWIGMFACGALAQRHFRAVGPFVEGKFLFWLALFALIVAAAQIVDLPVLLRCGVNELGLVAFVAIAGLTLSSAYTMRDLAERLLHRQDISYGVYIFHMPVINALLSLRIGNAAVAMTLTLGLAILSWRLVEQPALRAKSRPARAV